MRKASVLLAFLLGICPAFSEPAIREVFVLENPADRTEVLGYYTLSPAQLQFTDLSGSQQAGCLAAFRCLSPESASWEAMTERRENSAPRCSSMRHAEFIEANP